MTPERWQRVGELFHTALEQPGEQAREWVQAACQDDPEVLLSSHQEAGDRFVENQIQPMDTDPILHRFYREWQTLARLQHPQIPRLLDGGATENRLS